MAQDNVKTPADVARPPAPVVPQRCAEASSCPGPLSAVDWIALAVSAGVLIAFRVHAFDLPLETDECNYAYIGARLLAGDSLYIDVWDHQPFGVFALFAAVMAMFGDAPEVFRCLAVGFSLCSMGFVFLIVRRLSGTWIAACAALAFAVVSSDPGTAGEGCNREIFMNTLVLAAWWLAVRSRGSTRSLIVAGVLLGIGSTLKTVLAVNWLALAIWVMASARRGESAKDPGSDRWRRLISLAAGPTLIWGTSLAYFAATGRAGAFLDAAFRFNLGYSGSSEGFFARFVRFFSPVHHPYLFDSAWSLWVLLAPACVWLLVASVTGRHRGAAPVLTLIVASFVATCLPGRFWPHYYYLMIPPAVIACSLVAGDLASVVRRLIARTDLPPVAATMIIPMILPLLLTATQYTHYLNQPLFGITVTRYNSRDFWARGQGERVKSVTRATDTVFVFGHDTGIYYYAERKCASRYTMITGLQSGYSGVQARRKTLLAELQATLPRVILVLFDEPPFAGWAAFLERHYGPAVGVDYHDKTGKPIMAVFALASDPIKPIDWDWDRKEVGGW